MGRVTTADLEAVLSAAGELALLDSAEAFPQLALAELGRLIACDVASYNEVQLKPRRVRIISDPDPPVNQSFDDFSRLAHQNPLIRHGMETGDPSPVKFSDFMTLAQLRRTELFDVVYGPGDITRQLACKVDQRVGIALSRSGRDFTERDRSVLDLIRPHLAAGARRWRAWATSGLAGPGAELAAAQSVGAEGAERLASLTAREREIALLVGRGATNAEVARALMVAPKTVNAHLERVYRKLGVHRRAELAWRIRDCAVSAHGERDAPHDSDGDASRAGRRGEKVSAAVGRRVPAGRLPD